MNYTARQAFHVANKKINNFDAIYAYVSNLVMEHIKRYSEFHFTCCNFTIPKYIIGFAVFDWILLKRKLKKNLRTLEYKVETSKLDPGIICISWQHIANTVKSDGTC